MENLVSFPFSARAPSSLAEPVTQHSAAWVRELGLLEQLPNRQRYEMLAIGDLVTRTHPSFALAELQIIANWSLWLFVNDDIYQHLSPDELGGWVERCVAIVGGQDVPADTPLLRGLASLVEQTWPHVSERWREHFADNLRDHLASLQWETALAVDGRSPDIATYLDKRQSTSGFKAYADLLHISPGFTVPDDVRFSPPVQRMELMINNIASWANEVLSFDKEREQDDLLTNMVWVYHCEKGISVEDAKAQVISLCQSEIDNLHFQMTHLPDFGEDVVPSLRHYVSVLQDLVVGTFQWHFATSRYRQHWKPSQ
ncbi:MAG: hypothetical protein AAF799_48270 [Myxococcota bacterium]